MDSENLTVEYHPAVRRELIAIKHHYQQISPQLADHFLDDFEHAIQTIVNMPKRWPILQHGIRRALMKRFPYAIYYRVMSTGKLRITVLKHQKRHPAYGRNRK